MRKLGREFYATTENSVRVVPILPWFSDSVTTAVPACSRLIRVDGRWMNAYFQILRIYSK
jgi:hypothetical protein